MDISFLLLPAAASAALGAALFLPGRAGPVRAKRSGRDRAAPLQPDFRLVAATVERDGAGPSTFRDGASADIATAPSRGAAASPAGALARIVTALRSDPRHRPRPRLVPEFVIGDARAAENPAVAADASEPPAAGLPAESPLAATAASDPPERAARSNDGDAQARAPLGPLASPLLAVFGALRVDEVAARVRRSFARPSAIGAVPGDDHRQPVTPADDDAVSGDAEPDAHGVRADDASRKSAPTSLEPARTPPVGEGPTLDGDSARAGSRTTDRSRHVADDGAARRFAALVATGAPEDLDASAARSTEPREAPPPLDARPAAAAGLATSAASSDGVADDLAAPLDGPAHTPSGSRALGAADGDPASADDDAQRARRTPARTPHRSPERAIPLTRLPLRHETHDVTWPLRLEPPKHGLSTPERHRLLDGAVAQRIGLEILLDAYREEDGEGRVRVVRALGTSKTPQARSVLIEALQLGGDSERAEAIDSLLAIGAAEALVPALSDRVEAIAAKALLGLGTSVDAAPTRAAYKSLTAGHIEPARADALLALLGGFLG